MVPVLCWDLLGEFHINTLSVYPPGQAACPAQTALHGSPVSTDWTGCGGTKTLLSVLLLRPWSKEDSEGLKGHTSMSCCCLSKQPVVSLDHIWPAEFVRFFSYIK